MTKCFLLSVFVLLMLIPAVFCFVSGAPEDAGEGGKQKRSIPNWAMTSDDFFGWVEELRKHAGYEQIEELARTFWAHFPSADRLGYGAHEPDE
ncbi:otospiralin-like isoform X1 [Labrus bergylta]|uniref:otospiralin-like isoform X1 n=1 Tax=Labrus bergylta TaxID=56723 RepID=UPI0010FAECCC|nr:otospiralin-like isoform X1 [Labrus bergylta]